MAENAAGFREIRPLIGHRHRPLDVRLIGIARLVLSYDKVNLADTNPEFSISTMFHSIPSSTPARRLKTRLTAAELHSGSVEP